MRLDSVILLSGVIMFSILAIFPFRNNYVTCSYRKWCKLNIALHMNCMKERKFGFFKKDL